jgi:hypothetical protein
MGTDIKKKTWQGGNIILCKTGWAPPPNNHPIAMASVNELLGIIIERIIEASRIVLHASAEEVEDNVDEQEDFASDDAEVDEAEALPPLSLCEARDYCIRLLKFVAINHHFIKREGFRNNNLD